MSWGDAYRRAIEATAAVILICIVGGAALWFGGCIVVGARDYPDFVIGIPIAFFGAAGVILGVLATVIKTIADAIIDGMADRG